MNRRKRLSSALRIGLIGLTALALLLGGVAVALAYAGTTLIKRELARLVLDRQQRTLDIDGDLELRFWPALDIRLGHATLSEQGGAQRFAAFDGAHVRLQLLPLLSRQLVIDRVELTGLKASVIRHRDGSLNIADLLRSDNPDSHPLSFDIAGLRSENTTLGWRDEQNGQAFTLAALQLQTGRLTNAASDGRLQLHDLKLTARCCTANAAADEAWDLALQTGQIQARHGLDIAELQLTAHTRRDNDQLAFGLAAPRLQLAGAGSSASTLTLTASRAGPAQQAQLQLALTGLESRTKTLQAAKAALTLDAQTGAARFTGAFDSPLTADLAARTLDLPQLTGTLAIATPQLARPPLRLPLTAHLQADLAQQKASGQLGAQLDASHLAASFNVTRFVPLALDFNVEIDRLDLDRYLAPGKSGAQAAAHGGPADPSALRNIDLHGVVQLGILQMAGIKARNLRLAIQAGNGKIAIIPQTTTAHAASRNDRGHMRITQGKVN